MVKKKGKSKRLSLHKKYKILRRVREHKREQRKKGGTGGGKKKSPGIPNNWPFKEELMNQIEQARLAEIESQRLRKEMAKEEKARKKQEEKERMDALAVTPEETMRSAQRRKEEAVAKAIDDADVVLMVLDARDPQGCRSLTFEDGLIAKGKKKFALVLNKLDLIPVHTAQKWLNYLRRFHPTIPVKSLNAPAVDSKKPSKDKRTEAAIYAKTQELGDLRDNGNVDALHKFLDQVVGKAKGTCKVAVMGYPNVGKSTLVNSLKRKQVAATSKFADCTKELQEVEYSEKCTLVDCPPLDATYSNESSILMRHSIAGLFVVDPIPVIKSLLNQCDMVNLMQVLRIPLFKGHEDFLKKVAKKKNLYRKGGDLNVLLAARTLLKLIGDGSIALSCLPPQSKRKGYEMPAWYKSLKHKDIVAAEPSLFKSISTASDNLLKVKTLSASNVDGDTLEYEIATGNKVAMAESSDEEESEEESENDENEEASGDDESEEEAQEEQEDVEEEEQEVKVTKKRTRSNSRNSSDPAASGKQQQTPTRVLRSSKSRRRN